MGTEEIQPGTDEDRLDHFEMGRPDSIKIPVLSLGETDPSLGGRRSVAMSLLDMSDEREDPHPSTNVPVQGVCRRPSDCWRRRRGTL